MALRYSKGTEGQWAAHPRIFYDTDFQRYRWRFIPPEQACWSLPSAHDALAKEGALREAQAYIQQHGLTHVFGVVCDEAQAANLGLPAGRVESDAHLRDANQALHDGLDPDNDERPALLARTRVEALAAHKADPNNLGVSLFLAERAYRLGEFGEALSEWCDACCRLTAAVGLLRCLAVARPSVQRASVAYTDKDLAEIERVGALLEWDHVIELLRWESWKTQWHKDRAREWEVFEERVRIVRGDAGLLNIPDNIYGIVGARVLKIKELTRCAEIWLRDEELHAAFLTAVPQLSAFLTAAADTYHQPALALLVAIADPQCELAITHAISETQDTGWRGQMQAGLEELRRRVRDRGAAWSA